MIIEIATYKPASGITHIQVMQATFVDDADATAFANHADPASLTMDNDELLDCMMLVRTN